MKFEYEKIKGLCSKEISYVEETMLSVLNLRDDLKPYVLKFLTSPSKRIRPLLSILFSKSLGISQNNDHLKILSAVELVHNASLIHDDIIDESDFRRGEKTLSYEFGNKLGVICGDYLLSEAMNILCDINCIKIIKYFTQTLQRMCLGEVDQYFDKFKIGTIDQYIEKSKNKTAYLFEAALVAPFLLDDKNSETIAIASSFGLKFGIAFQMRDDILNLVSNTSSKPTKNDIEAGIYSASVIYSNDIQNYESGVEKACCLLNNYVAEAEDIIADFEDNIYTSALRELLELLKYE